MDDALDERALPEPEVLEEEEAAPAPWWARVRILLPGLVTTVGGAGITLALIGNAYATTLPGDEPDTRPTVAVQHYVVPPEAVLDDITVDRIKVSAAPVAPSGSSGGAVSMPTGPVAPVGEAQQYAAQQIAARGWAKKELACLVPLWSRESGWNAHAGRPNGPYGIPQAYPGTKMASAGGDWLNDHRVQIRWGLGYIAGRYGTPCGAWAHWQSAHSY
ncbi:lytic transglycosylase domain-containing protein [Amnibacterium endophyticum]|uniref:Lytic transglycosylase domain-containing protein n=1 Tax=Amnibacterium endophyticum TaxID=2109337 RepID=A0ABW4LCN4_9MICO